MNRDQVQLCLFDLIRCDDQLLYNQPLHERKAQLQHHFPADSTVGIQILSGQTITGNLSELIRGSVEGGCEGLVLKHQQSLYGCGLRNSKWKEHRMGNEFIILIIILIMIEFGYKSVEDWLKLKADYIVEEAAIDGFGDSLDVVILGAKYGRGTRSTSYGSFLCGMLTEQGVCRVKRRQRRRKKKE